MNRVLMAEVDVLKGLGIVRDKIQSAAQKFSNDCQLPRLVAVSKTKPKRFIIAAYEAGQRHFGENYVQELVEKGHDPEVIEKCPDIKWHFIGHLQSNKVPKVLSVPGLDVVETVDTVKLADTLNKHWEKLEKPDPLKVMVQVNTSGEDEKSGCLPDAAASLVQHICSACGHLRFAGFMTIGRLGHDPAAGPNPDFVSLVAVHKSVCEALQLPPADAELSMGMSGDFEHAIEMGSTSVRVGSLIFGQRLAP